MNELLPYILKSTLSLSLLYLAFRMVMRKETFFALNRILLLTLVTCSILIPLINLPTIMLPELQAKLITSFPVIENQLPEFPVVADPPTASETASVAVEKPDRSFNVIQLVGYIYLAGMLFSLLVLIHGLVSLLLLFRKAEIKKMEGYKLLIIEKDIPAFSFSRMIFISRADYTDHGSTILAHEQQHIRLGHFYDLLLMEMAKMIHWFNPVIYWLIQDLKAIHEYQADQHTLTKGIDANKYQLLIIEKSVGLQRLALANSFNHCQIKKRITMMNKQKTGKAWRWKVATFLPLLALLLMAFGREGKSEPKEIASTQVSSSSTSPIIGTWKLVAYNYGGGDDLNLFLPGAERIKTITESTFNWIQYIEPDRVVTSSAGGTYAFSGDSYTEYIEFSGQGMIDYIGKEQKFNVTFENNEMHLSGELSSGLRIKEVWERVESKAK